MVHDHRQRVVRDLELDRLDPGALTDRRLVLLDLPRGVRQVRLAAAEALEAAAGAGDANRHLDVGVVLLESLRRRGGERPDGAGSVSLDAAGQVAAGRGLGRRLAARLVVVAAPPAAHDRVSTARSTAMLMMVFLVDFMARVFQPRRPGRGCRMVKIS